MRSFDSFPGRPPQWTCRNGEAFDPANFRPAIDTTGNVYGIKPNGTAVVVHSYESYRVRSARDFAVWVWNHEKDWQHPVNEKTVRCLGEVCCKSQAIEAPGSDWRITDIKNGKLLARQTIGGENPADRLEIGEEHLLYASYYPEDVEPDRSRHLDIMIAAIEQFGAPFNAITGEVNPPFSNIFHSRDK